MEVVMWLSRYCRCRRIHCRSCVTGDSGRYNGIGQGCFRCWSLRDDRLLRDYGDRYLFGDHRNGLICGYFNNRLQLSWCLSGWNVRDDHRRRLKHRACCGGNRCYGSRHECITAFSLRNVAGHLARLETQLVDGGADPVLSGVAKPVLISLSIEDKRDG